MRTAGKFPAVFLFTMIMNGKPLTVVMRTFVLIHNHCKLIFLSFNLYHFCRVDRRLHQRVDLLIKLLLIIVDHI